MKELSIEEKARAYDRAIEKLHEIITMDNKPVNPKEIGKYLFPELKESEDEKIRNFLIKQANSVLDSITDDDEEVPAWKSALAWLEKQGEQKSIKEYNACEFCEDRYGCVSPCPMKLVEKKKPVFEMKTPEESLGINSDTYNKIVDECVYGEQKPAWSEDDDIYIENIILAVEKQYPIAAKDIVAWLTFLKERVLPQPKQEWSEEDVAMLTYYVRPQREVRQRQVLYVQ